MNDINFDLFRKEISFAEDYLRTNVSQSHEGNSTIKTRITRMDKAPNAVTYENGSHLFGRRSLASSENSGTTASSSAGNNSTQFQKPVFDGVSISMDSYWIEGGRPSQAQSEDWYQNRNQSLARYADPQEREKLIEKLLADHEQALLSSSVEKLTSKSEPLCRFDDPNSSMLQHQTEQLSVDSADSLDCASNNEDTLFFASDLNPPVCIQNDNLHAGSYEDESDYLNTSADQRNERESLSFDMTFKEYNGDVDLSERNIGLCEFAAQENADAMREYPNTGSRFIEKPSSRGQSLKSLKTTMALKRTAIANASIALTNFTEDEKDAENIHRNHSPTTRADRVGGVGEIKSSPVYEGRMINLAGSKAIRVKKVTPSRAATSGADTPIVDLKKRFHKSKEQLQKEAADHFKVQCAFKPTIISAAVECGSNRDPARGSRVAEMHILYKKSREERDKRKKEHLQAELVKCTFQPVITKMGGRSVRSSTPAAHFNAVDYLSGGTGYVETPERVPKGISGSSQTSMRLHREAEQRSAQQRWLEKQVEEARLAQFSFQPMINPANTSCFDDIDHRPIYERVGELQRERESRLRDLKQSHNDSQMDLTFTPRIDSRSRKIAQRRLDGKGDRDRDREKDSEDPDESFSRSASGSRSSQHAVGTRLHGEAALAARRKEQLRSEREEVLVLEMEPVKISKGSGKLAQQSPHAG